MIVQEPRRRTAEEDADLQRVETERLDVAALGQQSANEVSYLEADITYLQTIMPTIDSMGTTQIRAVVKGLAERTQRLEQENLKIIKALHYLVRLAR